MTSWSERSRRVIGEVHASLPADATYEQRKKALREAYPFGLRAHFPYKAWCTEQRKYLARYSAKQAGPLFGKDTP